MCARALCGERVSESRFPAGGDHRPQGRFRDSEMPPRRTLAGQCSTRRPPSALKFLKCKNSLLSLDHPGKCDFHGRCDITVERGRRSSSGISGTATRPAQPAEHAHPRWTRSSSSTLTQMAQTDERRPLLAGLLHRQSSFFDQAENNQLEGLPVYHTIVSRLAVPLPSSELTRL